MRKLSYGMGIGVLLGFILVACSGFNYVRYGLGIDGTKGLGEQMLLAKDPKDDVPLIYKCGIQQDFKSPCVVFTTYEYERLRADYGALLQRLRACEKK